MERRAWLLEKPSSCSGGLGGGEDDIISATALWAEEETTWKRGDKELTRVWDFAVCLFACS